MPKIVVNACYGGFGLSPLAEVEYAKRTEQFPYAYLCTIAEEDYSYHRKKIFENVSFEELLKAAGEDHYVFDYYLSNKDFGTTLPEDLNPVWYDEAHNPVFLTTYNLDRANPTLVQVVEELGEKADGDHASLRVADVPDDIDWEIDEYDGIESVRERHRSW